MVGTETPKRTANFPQRDHPVLIRQHTDCGLVHVEPHGGVRPRPPHIKKPIRSRNRGSNSRPVPRLERILVSKNQLILPRNAVQGTADPEAKRPGLPDWQLYALRVTLPIGRDRLDYKRTPHVTYVAIEFVPLAAANSARNSSVGSGRLKR